MKKFNPICYVEDDELNTPEIGVWGLKKYKLLGAYCDIFTSGMKNLWDELVFIDLFAGAGYAKLRNDSKVIMTSTLIASSIPHKFSKYIVSECDPDKLNSLKSRINKHSPNLNIHYINGDTNQNVDQIIDLTPKAKGVLRFCFVDPFSLNLEFNTIKKLSQLGRIDFLILLALQMDARRNFKYYINENSDKIDKFLGDTAWRKPFENGEIHQRDFIKYLGTCYDTKMKDLGYVVDSSLKYEVKNDSNSTPLYYLAFYSKDIRGNDFYKKIEKYQNFQLSLF